MTTDARLLAQRSEFGYTDRIDRALRDEPEAVPADYQRHLSHHAASSAVERDRADWQARRRRLQEDIAALRQLHYARGLGTDVRVLERQLSRIDRLIGAALANARPAT